MKIKTSAPGKVILFGEHTVVYKKPAIAVAIDKTVNVELISRDDDVVHVYVPSIDYSYKGILKNNELKYERNKYDPSRITDYIHEVIQLFKFDKGFDLYVNINMHLGAGLGSSAATTVASMKALSKYAGLNYDDKTIATKSRLIEIEIQGAASPIDTAMSTYGGMIYVDEKSNLNKIVPNIDLPLVVAFCDKRGNTGELVESVRQKYNKYPEIIENIFNAMATIAVDAKSILENSNAVTLGDLMNINQGLLDSIGVNTIELSDMVYISREHGAYGAKLTGSGGGGSIIAYCPENIDNILNELNKNYIAFKCNYSENGVTIEIIDE
jgi:mevalonate kinase